ncbi:MAG: response regulator, partial [Acidobacteriia bacterium]|nr:response regulator [Terriglobia bacterium]
MPVEDERIVARDLQSRLQRLGYEVPAVASSKTEALELVQDLRPDAVLMDITLNGVPEGIAAAKQIRERFDLPVIYLTAHSDSDTLDQAKHTEPFGYLLKPFEDRELMVAIETAIHKHGAEKRLRQTERWLAATLCSIGDAVIAMDETVRITFMNRVAEELTGWSTEEAFGKDVFAVFRLSSPAAETPARHLMNRVLSEGTPSELANPVLVARDGSTISVSDSVAPILDDQGKNSGLVLVFRDTTEKQRAQREIRERGEQQAAANRLAQRALGGLDFQPLLDEAAAEVCRLLHADVCEILEFSGDRRELRRRSVAGAGAGESAALDVSSAAAGYFLRESTPAALDRATENEPLLDRYGARSTAGVIFGAPERPYGILAVYSLTPRSFTQNQLEFLQSVAYTLRSALDRTAMEKLLREREHMESIGVLAGGVAHDFNNLLAIIMGNADE